MKLLYIWLKNCMMPGPHRAEMFIIYISKVDRSRRAAATSGMK